MIGEKYIEFGPADFIKGVSTTDTLPDGGFSSRTDAVNLTAAPGAIYPPATAVDSDTDTRLSGNIIASCVDMNTVAASNRLFVTDDGKFYRYNGTKLDAAGIALTASKTWTSGFTDMETGFGEVYVTSKEAITRVQNDNTIDAGADFPFSFTTGNVPHPVLKYETNLYYGDKNLLLVQTAAGTAPTTVLTLSSDQIIIALGIDPASGYMLISTMSTLDVSGTIPATPKLLWYDGNSGKVSKSAFTDDAILGFCQVGNRVKVGLAKGHVGELSGSGITDGRKKLSNVTASNTELPYKHRMAAIGSGFYVMNGLQVLAEAEIRPGIRAWFPTFKNTINSNKPLCLAAVGASKLGVAFATNKFYTVDLSDYGNASTAGSTTLYTNFYRFPRPIHPRSVYLEFDSSIPTSGNLPTVQYNPPSGATTNLAHSLGSTNGSGGTLSELADFIGFSDDPLNAIQIILGVGTVRYGIRRAILYYDVAE